MKWDEVWESDTHRAITKQRLLHSSPDEVWRAMESYGRHVAQRSSLFYDEELEQTLASRRQPLVDLALAKNASSHKVLVDLYRRAADGTGDVAQDKAVRLACLANRVATGMLWSFDALPGIDKNELRRIAQVGDTDEIRTLFGNPGCRAVLRDLYAGKPPFDDLDPKRRLLLVRCTAGNAGINVDDSSEHGPDMTRWDVHEGLAHLMHTAPVEAEWVRALHELLTHTDAAHLSSQKDEAVVRETVDRWKGVVVPKLYSTESGEQEMGYYTQLPLAEEFRCLLAVSYGRPFVGSKFVYLGAADNEDIAWRCAFYGKASLTTQQMEQAYERDDGAFVFAALWNDDLILKPDCRALLESLLRGDMQYHLYRTRCAQLKERHRGFNSTPVSELLEEEAPQVEAPDNRSAVEALATQLQVMARRLESLSRTVIWGLVILGAVLLWRH